MKGKFIIFEGIDGAGKSTVMRGCFEKLSRIHGNWMITAEPHTETEFGANATAMLKRFNLAPETQMLLFFADRAEHVAKVVRPALEHGENVLCDRFVLSTYAYQVYGNQQNPEVFYGLAREYLTMPDLTIVLRISPAEAEKRRWAHEPDSYELRGLDFFTRVAEGYEAAPKNLPCGKVEFVDAAQSMDKMLADCIKLIERVVDR